MIIRIICCCVALGTLAAGICSSSAWAGRLDAADGLVKSRPQRWIEKEKGGLVRRFLRSFIYDEYNSAQDLRHALQNADVGHHYSTSEVQTINADPEIAADRYDAPYLVGLLNNIDQADLFTAYTQGNKIYAPTTRPTQAAVLLQLLTYGSIGTAAVIELFRYQESRYQEIYK